MQTWIADGATGNRNTLDGVDQGIPLIDDPGAPVEVTINRARLPVMASDRQHTLPSLQRRADRDRGERVSR
ncbi:MAG: hypothetical protein M3495_05545 [Pseudomonadota bacterium]|nr:hypothetical protein [Gammaproteobacteria bacterium]MDQ3581095.1 hypothetical protein [Pseudomonadota bacterium]